MTTIFCGGLRTISQLGPSSLRPHRSMLYEIAVTNTCDYIYGRDSLCSDPQALSDICNTNFRNTPEKINRPCNEKSPQVKHVTKLCTAAAAATAGGATAGAASGNKDNERVEPLTADHRLLVDMLLGWLVIWAELSAKGGGASSPFSCYGPNLPACLPGGLSACLPAWDKYFKIQLKTP